MLLRNNKSKEIRNYTSRYCYLRGSSQKNLMGACGPLPKTLTVFTITAEILARSLSNFNCQ